MSPDTQLVLLYDGVCGFCDRVVQFVLARDRTQIMRFAPLQGEFARDVLARHPELQGIDSLILVDRRSGRELVTTRSAAAIGIAIYLGGFMRVAGMVFRLVPRFLRDAGYSLIASVRYRIFGRYDACPIPTPEQRSRFIE